MTETWEKIVIGIIAVLLVFWLFPGIRAQIERSREAPKDWPGLLIPLAFVVLFVVFLLSVI